MSSLKSAQSNGAGAGSAISTTRRLPSLHSETFAPSATFVALNALTHAPNSARRRSSASHTRPSVSGAIPMSITAPRPTVSKYALTSLSSDFGRSFACQYHPRRSGKSASDGVQCSRPSSPLRGHHHVSGLQPLSFPHHLLDQSPSPPNATASGCFSCRSARRRGFW